MALRPIRSIDYKDFMNTAGSVYNLGANNTDDAERFLNVGDGATIDGTVFHYWDNLDLIVSQLHNNADSSRYTTWHDPLAVDVTGAKTKLVQVTSSMLPIVPGEWDRIAGTQRAYTWGNTSLFIEIEDLVTWEFDATKTPVYANVHDNGTINIASATIGFMSNTSPDASSKHGRVFETWGYFLRPGLCRHTDGTQYYGLVLQDITPNGTNPPPGQPTGTPGLGTLIPNGITRYSTSSNNPIDGTIFETGTFQADSFVFNGLQFVPDDDDTPQQPKGFLVMYSPAFDNTADVTGQWYQYIKFLDFNPFAKSATPGSPSRVHMRETLFSRVEFLLGEAPATNNNSAGRKQGGSETMNINAPVYLPNSRTLMTPFSWLTGGDVGTNDIVWVEHSVTPIVTQIQPPTNLSTVKTAKTVNWAAKAVGSIGEGVPNKSMDWTLQRVSTIREALDTSFGATPSGATSTVANGPIDPNTLVVEFTDDAGATYVTLTEGVSDDYTVDEATGIITWEVGITGASPAGPAITGFVASYKHEDNPATPAHGTLLQSISTTDNTGQAQTRVRYADDDDLVGEFDRIDASVEED